MRGKAVSYPLGALEAGITPAYAGKSHEKLDIFHAERDHPRICGEKTKKIP